MAEAAIAQGAAPDTISSDIHVFSGNTPGMPYLTWVMSKFLNMGFSLEQVVAMATVNPARVIGRLPEARHAAGRRAGGCDDARGGRRRRWNSSIPATTSAQGKVHLEPAQAVVAGVPFGRPYQAPFSVR